MRFNPFEWSEINGAETYHTEKGRLWLRASQTICLYVIAEGYEVLAATGCEVDVTLSQEVDYRVESAADVRIFVYDPQKKFSYPEGEVFTNPDRMPSESGTMLEVRRALRMHQLEQRSLLDAIRTENATLQRLRNQVSPDAGNVSSEIEEQSSENQAEAKE